MSGTWVIRVERLADSTEQRCEIIIERFPSYAVPSTASSARRPTRPFGVAGHGR
jgi:hypothetical protein